MERSFPPMTRSSELRRHWGPKSRESLAHEPEINVRLMLNCSKRKPPLARACYSAPQVWSSNTKYRTLPRRPGRRYRRVCAPGRKSYPGILPRFPVPPSATCLARYSQHPSRTVSRRERSLRPSPPPYLPASRFQGPRTCGCPHFRWVLALPPESRKIIETKLKLDDRSHIDGLLGVCVRFNDIGWQRLGNRI